MTSQPRPDIDITQDMLDERGRPIKEDGADAAITLGDAILGALTRPSPDDAKIIDLKRSTQIAICIRKVAKAIDEKTPLQLTSSQVTTILERGAKVFWMAPAVTMRLIEHLDPARLESE